MTIGVPGCGKEGDVFLYMDVIPAKAPPVRENFHELNAFNENSPSRPAHSSIPLDLGSIGLCEFHV